MRASGYAASREEYERGFSPVAVPVLRSRGGRRFAVAAISVVGSTNSILGARKVAVVQSVRRAAVFGVGGIGAISGVSA